MLCCAAQWFIMSVFVMRQNRSKHLAEPESTQRLLLNKICRQPPAEPGLDEARSQHGFQKSFRNDSGGVSQPRLASAALSSDK